MSVDPSLVLAGALVGLMVGMTGMGGGALLTPILVLVFKVPPLAAVSSDLVTSLVMKPFGGAVHLRKGTVIKPLLGWLVVGSVPAAFVGSVVIGRLGSGGHAEAVQSFLKVVIALALIASVAGTCVRTWVDSRTAKGAQNPLVIRPGRTVVIGAIGGLAVGLTSVGAGTLIIAMLLFAYPQLRPQQLVGTDIVQAIPLVAAASLGHLLFGAVHFGITASLLVGSIPAVILGAKPSSSAPSGVIRPIVAAVLMGSAFALLAAPAPLIFGGALAAAVIVSTPELRELRARWSARSWGPDRTDSAEPAAAEPVTAEPVTAEPVAAEPVTDPIAAEPVATRAVEPAAADGVPALPIRARGSADPHAHA